MARGSTRWKGTYMLPSNARRSSNSSNRCTIKNSGCQGMTCGCHPHFALLPAALALCLAYLPPVVNAQDKLKVNLPSVVPLCRPFNLTWSGGTPPYRLDVEPFVNGSPDTPANQRKIGIQNTWVLWVPDFPPGSTLQITVSDNSSDAGGHATEVSSSDSSCLNDTSSTTSMAPYTSASPSPANGPFTSIDQPSATSPSSPVTLASSGGGLSKGAIAGIAIAAILISIGLIAFAAWCLLRRRIRVLQPEKSYDRSIVSPAFSDDAPTIPYTGLSSTLASATADPSKLVPPTSATGSPDAPEDLLRPTPYLVPRESTTSLSQLRGPTGGKKHAHELSDPASTLNASAANLSATVPDARATSASPSQLGPDGGDGNGDDEGHGGGGVLRSDPDGTARLSAVGGGFGLGFSDVASNSGEGEATLPPPYTQVHFRGGLNDEVGMHDV